MATALTNLGINLGLYATLTGATFTGAASGIAPVGDTDFVTKGYADANYSGGATPAASHALYAGWSADATPADAEFTANSDTHELNLPIGTGNLYLIIWRSDADGGDPGEVHISGGGNSRNNFGDAADYTLNSVAGKVIVSITTQNADLLSGESLRVA